MDVIRNSLVRVTSLTERSYPHFSKLLIPFVSGRAKGMPQATAILEGAKMRFRPVMMTATVAALGLIPFLFSTGPGSEVQRPLAVVVIGVLVSSTLLTLVMLPALCRIFEGKENPHELPAL